MGSYQVLIVTERDNDYSSPKQWTLTPPPLPFPSTQTAGPTHGPGLPYCRALSLGEENVHAA